MTIQADKDFVLKLGVHAFMEGYGAVASKGILPDKNSWTMAARQLDDMLAAEAQTTGRDPIFEGVAARFIASAYLGGRSHAVAVKNGEHKHMLASRAAVEEMCAGLPDAILCDREED